MGSIWVLHTETKGTGAEMVPLERVTKRRSGAEPVFVPPKRPEQPERAPEPRAPRKFKVENVLTRQALIEAGTAEEAVGMLQGARSIVDVNVYLWNEERGRWRMLTFAEKRAMWELARS
jgi:hypothetical protein